MRSLGFLVTNNEVNDLRAKYDPGRIFYVIEVFWKKKDGRRDAVDLKDFLSCIIDVSNKVDGPEIIKQCFSVLDKNETGLVKMDEFRHLMKSIGDPLSNEEVGIFLYSVL